MKFIDRLKEVITEDDYDFDEDELNIKELSLDELEKEIISLCDRIVDARGLKGLVIHNLYINELNDMIEEFNERCPAYDLCYDEYGVLKDFSKKQYTGYYNGIEYYRGIKILGSKKDVPNLKIRK